MPRQILQTVHSERTLPGGHRVEVGFRAAGDPIPGVLLLPSAAAPVPAVLLLHGYSSRKEHLSEGMGMALLRLGVASLAIDLPLHGARGDAATGRAARNPLAVFGLWKTAVAECRVARGYLAARPETDASRLGVAGYSLASFLAITLAADDPAIHAVVVAAGGDLPAQLPFAAVARRVADPVRAVRKLAGRPLLMTHGRRDATVRPEQAERLFAAAAEPKEIRWWDAGHILPPAAIDHAAAWLSARLSGPIREG